MLLIHTESKVSLEVLTDTKPNPTWSGRATQYMSEGGRSDGTPNAQSEHSYPYFTLICPFLQNAGRITHGKRNWEKTEVRKSELKRGAKGGAAKSHALFHVTCLQKVPLPPCFISAYSSGITQNLVPGTCKVQALFRTELGSWESSVLFQTRWKPGRIRPSYFWRGEGAWEGRWRKGTLEKYICVSC